MTYYPNLFAKGKLGKVATRNRIIMSPMGDNMANADGSVSEQSIAYYAERAKGGAAVIIPGVFSVDYPRGKTITNQHRIDHAKYIKDLERMAKEIHRYGALLIPQIHHAGMSTEVVVTEGMAPVQVSAPEVEEDKPVIGAMVDEAILSKVDVKLKKMELSTEDIKTLVQKFITAAVYCQRAGCDGVELHGAHGYLISQFLTPVINKRTDEYGGSLENRMRFPIEIIKGIRKNCGNDFVLGIRMPVHKWDADGLTDEESVAMAQAFVAAGCDFIDASGGFPPAISEILETQKYPQGNRIELAEKMKKAVDIPVFAVGVLREPEYCDKAIADGKTDFVCIGRGLIADPYWPAKAKAGKANEIRKCISCLDGCYGALGRFQSVHCAINPTVGYEAECARLQPSSKKKKVVIVGGGVAGMQAAITATERGHKAIILEKSGKLAGQLNLACIPPHKQFINWQPNGL